jgi:hypothetical protein
MTSLTLFDSTESILQLHPFQDYQLDLWPFAVPVLLFSALFLLLHLTLTSNYGRQNVVSILQHNSPEAAMPFVYQIVLYLRVPPLLKCGRDGKRALQIFLLSHQHKEMVELRLTERMLFSSWPRWLLLLFRSLSVFSFVDLFAITHLTRLRQVQFQLHREAPMSHLLGVRVKLTQNVNGTDSLRRVYLHGISTYCLRSGLAYYSSIEQLLHPLEMLNRAAYRDSPHQHAPLTIVMKKMARWRVVRFVRSMFRGNEPMQLDLAGSGRPGAPGPEPCSEDQAYASEVRSPVEMPKHQIVSPNEWKMRRGRNGNLDPTRSIIYSEEPPFACTWQGTGIPFDHAAHAHAGAQINFVYEHLLRYFIRNPQSPSGSTAADSAVGADGKAIAVKGISMKKEVKAKPFLMIEPQDLNPLQPGSRLTTEQWKFANQELFELAFGVPQVALIKNIDSSADRSQHLNQYIVRLRHGILFSAHLSPIESLIARWMIMLLSQLNVSLMLFRGIAFSGGWNRSVMIVMVAVGSFLSVVVMEQLITFYTIYFKTPFDSLDANCWNHMRHFGSTPVAWIGRYVPFYRVVYLILRALVIGIVFSTVMFIHVCIPIILMATLRDQLANFNVIRGNVRDLLRATVKNPLTFQHVMNYEEKNNRIISFSDLFTILTLTSLTVLFSLRIWPFVLHVFRTHLHETLCNWQLEIRNLATYDVPEKKKDNDNEAEFDKDNDQEPDRNEPVKEGLNLGAYLSSYGEKVAKKVRSVKTGKSKA